MEDSAAGDLAFESLRRRKFKGDEKSGSPTMPTRWEMTKGAWDKANKLGQLVYFSTQEKLGQGTETLGLLLGSKNPDDHVIRDVCLIKHHARDLHASAANDYLDGLKTYMRSGEYRVLGVYHTHPYFNSGHSHIDDPNLKNVIFPQVASQNFFYHSDEIRLLGTPISLKINNSASGALFELAEKDSRRKIRIWLPGCKVNSDSLEANIAEFDMLYDRLSQVSYGLSLILDLKGGYELKVACAPRGQNHELLINALTADKVPIEVMSVEKDVAFTDEYLLDEVKNNVVELAGCELQLATKTTEQRERAESQSKTSLPKTKPQEKAPIELHGGTMNIKG